MFSESVIQRFWKFVVVKNGCWSWSGSKSRGYGQIRQRRGESPAKAHRVSWYIANGEIPKGMSVCHRCDNPECTNPEHLFLGTHRENMTDASKKGRINNYIHESGSKNNSSILSSSEVNEIRREYTEGATIEDLTKKYGYSNIVRIVRNKAYYDPSYTPINANSRPRPHRKSLTPEEVVQIMASPLSSRKLGEIYRVSKTTIAAVKKGEYTV